MPALNPELEAALEARLRYYRDLGIYTLYRRGQPDAAQLEIATETATESEPEPAIPPRKIAPAPPDISAVLPVLPADQRQAALEAIRRGASDFLPLPLDQIRLKRTLDDMASLYDQRRRVRALEEQLLKER